MVQRTPTYPYPAVNRTKRWIVNICPICLIICVHMLQGSCLLANLLIFSRAQNFVFVNHLRVSYIHHGPLPLNSHECVPKSREGPLCSHCTLQWT